MIEHVWDRTGRCLKCGADKMGVEDDREARRCRGGGATVMRVEDGAVEVQLVYWPRPESVW